MENDQSYFFYPANLKKKTLFIAWTGVNITIIIAALVLSVLVFFLTFVYIPVVITILYTLLTLTPPRYERSLADSIRDYINYLFLDQLEYTWGEPEPILTKEGTDETRPQK